MRALALIPLVLLLSGCIGAPPPDEPSPTPSATPVFASEEEALAAAEAAYARYLEVSDAISSEGGARPERVEPLVTARYLPIEYDGYTSLSEKGLSTEGRTVFDSMSIQDVALGVSVYVCLDVTLVRLKDNQGTDVTPANRPERIPLVVGFEPGDSGSLLLDSSDAWTGADYCD